MTRSTRTVLGSVSVVLALALATASSLAAQQGRVRRAPAPAPAPAPAAAAAQPAGEKSGDAAAEALVAPAKADAGAAAKPRLETPQGTFELVEWVVLVVDAHRPNANEPVSFKSTVPGFARGRRPSADAVAMKDPSPVGVIRLLAKPGVDEEPIDVLIQVPAGRFHGNWPQGKPKAQRQLWDRIMLAEGKGKPVPVDPGHWFETLRKPDERSAPLSTSRWSERFLLYDVEVTYPNVLRLRAGGEALAYRAANAGSAPLRDVQFYLPAEGGWRVGSVEELPATQAPPPPTTKPAGGEGPAAATTQPVADAAAAAAEVFAEARPAPPTTAPAALVATPEGGAATQPATQSATQPAPDSGDDLPPDAWREFKIAAGDEAKPLSAADAVAGWRERLTAAGLSAADADVICATLRVHALDAEQLTVVYRMDAAELDRLLPLEVVPQPTKVTRVGIAVIKNADPAAGERIAKLIEQLASDDWDQREAANAKLASLGAGARPKLSEALKHKDLEVVYRAERLLDALNAPPVPVEAEE